MAPHARDGLVDALRARAHAEPHRIAIRQRRVGDEIAVSYGELFGMARRAAAVIAERAPAAPLIPIFMERSIASIAVAYGVLSLGRRFAFLNPRLRLPQIEDVLERAGGPPLITDLPALTALRPNTLPDDAFLELSLLLLFLEPVPKARQKLLDRVASRCEQFEAINLVADRSAAEIAAETDFAAGCCLFTSGSTGSSKGVLIAADDLYHRARHEVAAFGLTEQDRIMNLLPFSFDVGLNQITATLLAGAELVLTASWLPRDMHSAIAEAGITGFSGVPTIWDDYLAADYALGAGADQHRLRYVTVSGGSLPPARFEALRDAAPGVSVIKTYGQTETFRTTALLPAHPSDKTHSVGAAFGDVQIAVVDESLAPCPPDVVGEVIHAGLGVMDGYLDGSGADKLVDLGKGIDAPGMTRAIRTGDLGTLDCDGFLHLKGRRDAMVKIHGNRVYPEEVQALIRTLDGVVEAEVLPLPAKTGSEPTLAAFVTAAGPLPPADFDRRLGAVLPAYMLPGTVRFLDEIPRTANGKPDRQRLLALCGAGE